MKLIIELSNKKGNKNLDKDYNLSFKIFYFFYCSAAGAFTPYINLYLEKNVHFNGSEIGLISGVSLGLSVLIIPIWGIIGDRTKKYNLIAKISFIILILMIALYYKVSIYSYKTTVYLKVILCVIVLEICRNTINTMSDIKAIDFCSENNKNFGAIRSFGSVGYMIGGMLIGFLSDRFGLRGPLFSTYIYLMLIAFPFLLGFPSDLTKNEIKEDKIIRRDSFIYLLADEKFVFILIITVLVNSSVDSSMNFIGNHLVSTLQGDKVLLSWMTLITILPEFFLLLFTVKIIDKIGYRKFYMGCILLLILRYSIYSFTKNEYIFLLLGILHAFNVAILTVGNLTYILRIVEKTVLGTSITIYNSATLMGKAIFTYLFGIIYQYSNSYVIFMVTTLSLIIAFIVLVTNKNFKNLRKLA